MKQAKLLYNPSAGEDDHTIEDLVSLLKNESFQSIFTSVKEPGWDRLESGTDFLILAGGDGTVRKVVKAFLEKKVLKKMPIALLPLGTANNIAQTLNINGDKADIIKSWRTAQLKKFDIGVVNGLEKSDFFLEGVGFGLFPRLMKEMEKLDDSPKDVSEIKRAQVILHAIVQSYEPRYCEITADGVDVSGYYLMVEIMNIKSIGPRLILAADADPGDGELEVVLIPESHQQKFEVYLLKLISNIEASFSFMTLKAKSIDIKWKGSDAHIDDQLIKNDKSHKLSVSINEGALAFFVSGDEKA
jgi:diacylglycerol kinase (ATP)